MFEWKKLISYALCSQFANYLTIQKKNMDAYLVFAVVYCNVFDILLVKANVDIQNEPVQLWDLVLSKRKEIYNFCIVQDSFVKQFKHMLVGIELRRIT